MNSLSLLLYILSLHSVLKGVVHSIRHSPCIYTPFCQMRSFGFLEIKQGLALFHVQTRALTFFRSGSSSENVACRLLWQQQHGGIAKVCRTPPLLSDSRLCCFGLQFCIFRKATHVFVSSETSPSPPPTLWKDDSG